MKAIPLKSNYYKNLKNSHLYRILANMILFTNNDRTIVSILKFAEIKFFFLNYSKFFYSHKNGRKYLNSRFISLILNMFLEDSLYISDNTVTNLWDYFSFSLIYNLCIFM